MSLYPVPVSGQELYGSSTEKLGQLGAVGHFEDSNGYPIEARYMSNGETVSVAAGQLVAYKPATPGQFVTTWATSNPTIMVAGGLAASPLAPLAPLAAFFFPCGARYGETALMGRAR